MRTFPTLASAQALVRQRRHARRPTPAAIAADNALIAGVYAGPQNYQTQLFGNAQASYQTERQRQRHVGADAVLTVGPVQVRQRHHAQHGLQQAVGPLQHHRSSSRRSSRVSANLNYIHDVTRRGITGNDNIGISPYNVFSYTPGFDEPEQAEPRRHLADQPVRPGEPVRRRGGDRRRPRNVSRFIGGATSTGRRGRRSTRASSSTRRRCRPGEPARPALRAARPAGRAAGPERAARARRSPTRRRSTTSTTQLNLIHHYTGFSWLDATTSVGSRATGASSRIR